MKLSLTPLHVNRDIALTFALFFAGSNIAKTANVTVSSVYVWNKQPLARKETLTDGKIWTGENYFNVCFHSGRVGP